MHRLTGTRTALCSPLIQGRYRLCPAKYQFRGRHSLAKHHVHNKHSPTHLIICPICDHGFKLDFFYRAENSDQDVNNCPRISLQGKIAHNRVLLRMEVRKGKGEERRESSGKLCPETQISVQHQRKPPPRREQNMGREKEKEIDEMKEGSQA